MGQAENQPGPRERSLESCGLWLFCQKQLPHGEERTPFLVITSVIQDFPRATLPTNGLTMTMNATPASSGGYRRDLNVQALMDGITLLSAQELAISQGFSSANDSFRMYLKNAGITPVPHRRGYFDPKHVRARLNSIQGLHDDRVASTDTQPTSLVKMRRARLGQE